MPEKKPKFPPLQTCEVSAEILILFQENPGARFTVRAVQRILNIRYNTSLSFRRVKQIIDALEKRERIERIGMIIDKYQETGTWTMNGHSQAGVLVGGPEHEALTILLDNARGNNS